MSKLDETKRVKPELLKGYPKSEAQVRLAIAERRNPRLVAKSIIMGGPERVKDAHRFFTEQDQPDEDRLRKIETQGHLYVLADDRQGAETIIAQLVAGGPKARATATKVMASAMMSRDASMAEHLVAVARRIAPNAREIAEIGTRLMVRQGDQQGAASSLAAIQDEFPKSTDVAVRKARAAGRLHRWEEARVGLEAFVAGVQRPGRAKDMLKMASLYANAQDPEGRPVGPLANLDVRYLNLDSDVERRERIEAAFTSCGIELIRTPAVRGSWLPDIVKLRVGERIPRLQSPTLGVFLSHVRTWELVADSGRPSLVLEDDAYPIFRLASVLETLATRVQDLTFVNYRLARWIRRLGPQPERFQQIPLEQMASVLSGEAAPPGGDGYILSPAGARKLLDYVRQDGCIGHVDVQMLSYGLKPSDYSEDDDGGPQVMRLSSYWKRHGGARRLDAHVLYPALTEAIDFGESARRAGETERRAAID